MTSDALMEAQQAARQAFIVGCAMTSLLWMAVEAYTIRQHRKHNLCIPREKVRIAEEKPIEWMADGSKAYPNSEPAVRQQVSDKLN